MTYDSRIAIDGSVPLPPDLVAALGFKPGDAVEIDQAGDGIVIRRRDRRDAAIARLRAAMGDYSVDRFLAERRIDSGE